MTKDEFYNAYKNWCDENGTPAVEKKTVGSKLPSLVTTVGYKPKDGAGKQVQAWKNIILTIETEEEKVRKLEKEAAEEERLATLDYQEWLCDGDDIQDIHNIQHFSKSRQSLNEKALATFQNHMDMVDMPDLHANAQRIKQTLESDELRERSLCYLTGPHVAADVTELTLHNDDG